MSMILKGIDLPKEDEVMVITVWGDDKDGTAFISNKEPSIVVPINAIQIPKGHGDIVDINNVNVEEDVYYQCYRVNAPTILEAENSDG